MTLLRSAALSDIGRVRRNNEDRLLHDPEAMLFGVADGIGGLPGGADAAQRTVDEIAQAVRLLPAGAAPDLAAMVRRANASVYKLSLRLSPVVGMGSTLTFGLVRDGFMHLAHVGDSRCYRWTPGGFSRQTEDHSVENEARLRRAQGETVDLDEGNGSAITRCIGQSPPPVADIVSRPLQAGDRYLFCTDGITRLLSDADLAALMAHSLEPEKILREIVTLALRRGGPDNVTGVLVIVVEP
jgi:protein phosphatase